MPGRRIGLALAWWWAAAAVTAVVAAAAGGLVWGAFVLRGGELGEVQRSAWLGVARAVGLQALAPLAAWTVAAWWAACTARPALDRRWSHIAAGLAALAALGFPAVAPLSFHAWTPGGPADYLGTWLLVAGGVTAALLVGRRLLPPLGPGALSRSA